MKHITPIKKMSDMFLCQMIIERLLTGIAKSIFILHIIINIKNGVELLRMGEEFLGKSCYKN
ncbi:MAG: hypothetical protein IJ706_06645 [Clostridia bacterium]|nr:hypothetical protein [Clostridia bacterium]